MYVYYAVLHYYPNIAKTNSINVGLAISVPSEGLAKFIRINDLTRFQKVDPDYDPEYFQAVLESFDEIFNYEERSADYDDASETPHLQQNFSDIHSYNFLEHRINEYNNEFQFGPIQVELTKFQKLPKLITQLTQKYLTK